MMPSNEQGSQGFGLSCMRSVSIIALILWPLIGISVVMLSDNPNAGATVSFFSACAYYLTLLYPVACLAALWLDRKSRRQTATHEKRVQIWALPVGSLVLIGTFILLTFGAA